MKLSSKIILGFVLTNVLYILLLGIIFVFVKPVETGSQLLSRFVLPAAELTNGLLFHVAEERSQMRAFIASPTNDRKIFSVFTEASNAADNDIAQLNGLLTAPEAAALATPELSDAYRKTASLNQEYTGLAMATPERQDAMLNVRTKQFTAYEAASQALGDALKSETENIESEIRSNVFQDDLLRRVKRITDLNTAYDLINTSYLALVRGVLRNDLALMETSLAGTARAGELLGAVIADTRRQAVREILEKAQKAVKEDYEPLLKSLIDLVVTDNDVTTRRNALIDATIVEAQNMTEIMTRATNSFMIQMAGAVNKVVLAMIVGALAALALTMILAVFLTRGIVKPIDHVISSLTESAREVDMASSQLTSASNLLAEGATENAASLEETSAALEELSSMTKRNADNAMEANGLTGQAVEAVTGAQDSMSRVITAMDEISHSGNEIGKIIKTIDEIAFQTNLLALNAAVEAARAGEAGAGFAVVADEVRNLAIRSADAAKNTADLIAGTISNINSGSEMVNATAELFKSVENSTSKVSELIAEVAEASKEQSQGIGQISTAMGHMDKVTQANAASSEESASAAQLLSQQAGALLGAVDEMSVLTHGTNGGRQISSGPSRPALPAKKSPAKKGGAASSTSKALPMNNDDDFSAF